jgi:hypothetical protein
MSSAAYAVAADLLVQTQSDGPIDDGLVNQMEDQQNQLPGTPTQSGHRRTHPTLAPVAAVTDDDLAAAEVIGVSSAQEDETAPQCSSPSAFIGTDGMKRTDAVSLQSRFKTVKKTVLSQARSTVVANQFVRAQNMIRADAGLELARKLANPDSGVDVKDRRQWLKMHPSCFVGKEAILWLVEHKESQNRTEALTLMRHVVRHKWVSPITFGTDFEDNESLYRFTIPTRKRQSTHKALAMDDPTKTDIRARSISLETQLGDIHAQGPTRRALRRASISAAGVVLATDFSDSLVTTQDWGNTREEDEFNQTFDRVTKDGALPLDGGLLRKLGREVGIPLKATAVGSILEAYKTDDDAKCLSRKQALEWYTHESQSQKRSMLLKASQLFKKLDLQKDGVLTEPDVVQLMTVLAKEFKRWTIQPPFCPDNDWPFIDTLNIGRVSFNQIRPWLRRRLGIVHGDYDVIPEFISAQVERKVAACDEHCDEHNNDSGESEARFKVPPKFRGAEYAHAKKSPAAALLWSSLQARLVAYVHTVQRWPHSTTEVAGRSRYDVAVEHPACMRHPDSTFSVFWDVLSAVALVYVAFGVPFNVGFSYMPALFSFGWTVDAIVDVFFISDVTMTFLTAFYTPVGLLNWSKADIARRYMRGWFAIDMAASLPFQYLEIIIDASTDTTGEEKKDDAQSHRGLRVLRLFRLAKLLRLGRIKRILDKYQDNVATMHVLNLLATLFSIVLLTHIISCVWYLLGTWSFERSDGMVIGPLSRFGPPGTVIGAQEIFYYCKSLGKVFLGPRQQFPGVRTARAGHRWLGF